METAYGKMPYGRGLGVAGSTYIRYGLSCHLNEMPQSGVQVRSIAAGAPTSCGASDIGQGSDTMLALIAAEELGIEPDKVQVTSSDTDLSPSIWAYPAGDLHGRKCPPQCGANLGSSRRPWPVSSASPTCRCTALLAAGSP